MYDFDMDLNHSTAKGMVPRLLLTSLLTLLTLTVDTSVQKEKLKPMPLPSINQERKFTWLTSLNRALPHSWRDSAATTSTSLKHDNVLVQSPSGIFTFHCCSRHSHLQYSGS